MQNVKHEDEMGPDDVARTEAEYRRVTQQEAHAERIAVARLQSRSAMELAASQHEQHAAALRRHALTFR
jgi:hypothetical protein